MDEKPVAINEFRCPFCDGPVDRFARHYQCRDCNAYGDIGTSLMSPYVELPEEWEEWDDLRDGWDDEP